MEKRHFAKDIVSKAISYVGYLEKKSNSDLDSFKGNAGRNNYNKFARDAGFANGVSWCMIFVTAIFNYAYGSTIAQIMLSGKTASCSTFARNSANAGRFVSYARPGYPILFKEKSQKDKYDMAHVGIVIGADQKYVYTVEGNTSSDAGVVANGGSVNYKRYEKSNKRIGGYVMIPYELVAKPALPVETVKKGCVGLDTKRVQAFLNFMGITDDKNEFLALDGSCGAKTVAAIKKFQKIFYLDQDGSFGPACRNEAKQLLKNS